MPFDDAATIVKNWLLKFTKIWLQKSKKDTVEAPVIRCLRVSAVFAFTCKQEGVLLMQCTSHHSFSFLV